MLAALSVNNTRQIFISERDLSRPYRRHHKAAMRSFCRKYHCHIYTLFAYDISTNGINARIFIGNAKYHVIVLHIAHDMIAALYNTRMLMDDTAE